MTRYTRTRGGVEEIADIPQPEINAAGLPIVHITSEVLHMILTDAGWSKMPTEPQLTDPPQPPTTFETTTQPVVIETPPAARAFEVDTERRTIYGLAVPFGVPTGVPNWDGMRFVFQRGALVYPADVTRIKLLISHDRSQAVGKLIDWEETDEGLWAKFSVAKTPEGDHALQMAADGVWDGLSIGLRDKAVFVTDEETELVTFTSAELAEISLTPDPAFADARVATVKAEAPTTTTERSRAMPCEKCKKVHAEGVTECQADPGTFAAPAAAPPAFDMEAFANVLATAQSAQLAAALAQAGPALVSPAGETGFEADASPYAFEANRGPAGQFLHGGEHEFSTDLFAAARGDLEANARAMAFMQQQFAVNVAGSPIQPVNRPDMYVDQRDYRFPLWAKVNKGTLADGTPFIFPKFSSASGLAANHTEGVEPTPGAFVATSQTVTPTAVSGKVEITREVFDAGGNPQVSNLIWGRMVAAYNEALEATVVSTLTGLAASITDIVLTTAAVDAALVDQLLGELASLQFVRGGFAMDAFALQIDLFKALAAAKDSTGRKLLPYIGPTNAAGSSQARFGSLDIQGVEGFPSWALAASSTNSENSWLFDSNAVHGWASVPQRFDFQYRVAFVDMAIWGYKAVAVSDTSGVRQVTYDRV